MSRLKELVLVHDPNGGWADATRCARNEIWASYSTRVDIFNISVQCSLLHTMAQQSFLYNLHLDFDSETEPDVPAPTPPLPPDASRSEGDLDDFLYFDIPEPLDDGEDAEDDEDQEEDDDTIKSASWLTDRSFKSSDDLLAWAHRKARIEGFELVRKSSRTQGKINVVLTCHCYGGSKNNKSKERLAAIADQPESNRTTIKSGCTFELFGRYKKRGDHSCSVRSRMPKATMTVLCIVTPCVIKSPFTNGAKFSLLKPNGYINT